MWESLHARHVYLDANVVIEAFEGTSVASARLRMLLALIEQGSVLASTSQLTLAEVLVRPLATGDRARVQDYHQILSPGAAIAVLQIEQAVLVAAAQICAETKMPLPDCIHVATAVRAGCDVFISNDRGIVLPPEMQRVVQGAVG